jgi:hypothetical protein
MTYQSGPGWVRVEVLLPHEYDIEQVSLGGGGASLERAFDEGWNAWLAP